MLRRVDSCIAVASATSQARGGAPMSRAVWMMVAALRRCSSLRLLARIPEPPPASPASQGPYDCERPAPLPVLNRTKPTPRNNPSAAAIATNGMRSRSGRSRFIAGPLPSGPVVAGDPPALGIRIDHEDEQGERVRGHLDLHRTWGDPHRARLPGDPGGRDVAGVDAAEHPEVLVGRGGPQTVEPLVGGGAGRRPHPRGGPAGRHRPGGRPGLGPR